MTLDNVKYEQVPTSDKQMEQQETLPPYDLIKNQKRRNFAKKCALTLILVLSSIAVYIIFVNTFEIRFRPTPVWSNYYDESQDEIIQDDVWVDWSPNTPSSRFWKTVAVKKETETYYMVPSSPSLPDTEYDEDSTNDIYLEDMTIDKDLTDEVREEYFQDNNDNKDDNIVLNQEKYNENEENSYNEPIPSKYYNDDGDVLVVFGDETVDLDLQNVDLNNISPNSNDNRMKNDKEMEYVDEEMALYEDFIDAMLETFNEEQKENPDEIEDITWDSWLSKSEEIPYRDESVQY